MKTRARAQRRRLRRRVALKIGVLLIPVLFWSAVFASLAGARTPESAVVRVHDPAQILVAATCALLALVVGLDAVRKGSGAASRELEKGRMKFSNSRNAGGQMS